MGVLGGSPGATSAISFSDGTIPHQKSRTQIAPGMRLNMRFAGGGGYGEPGERDPDQLDDDIKNGYVSSDAARQDYGS
jgi:N-methylhydantoinase B